MFQRRLFLILVLLLFVAAGQAADTRPSVAQFKQVFEAQLQKLKPDGFTARTVLFQEVRPGTPNGGYYPFQVTAIPHDYGPGYPANRYYGRTRVGRLCDWKTDPRCVLERC
jgi:hypothetical protein